MNINKVENRNVFECIEMEEIKKITRYEENSDDHIIFDDLSEYSPSIISNNDNIHVEKKIVDEKLLQSMINSDNLLKHNQLNWYDNLDAEEYKDNSIFMETKSKFTNIMLGVSSVSMNPNNIRDNNVFLTNKDVNTFEINNINLPQQNGLIHMNTINVSNDNYEQNKTEEICDTTKSDNSFLDIDQEHEKIKIGEQQEIEVIKVNESRENHSSKESTKCQDGEAANVEENEENEKNEKNEKKEKNENIEQNKNYSSEFTLKDNNNYYDDHMNMILTSNECNEPNKINYNNLNDSDNVRPIEGDIMNNPMSLSTHINNNDKKKLRRSSMSGSLKTYNSYNFKNMTSINNRDNNLNSFLKKKMYSTGSMYDIKVPIKKYFQGLKKINNLLSKGNNNDIVDDENMNDFVNDENMNDFVNDENMNDFVNDDEEEVGASHFIVNNNNDDQDKYNLVNKINMENLNKMNKENIPKDEDNMMYLKQSDSKNSFDNYWDVDDINKKGPFPSSKLSVFLNENGNNEQVHNMQLELNNIQHYDNKGDVKQRNNYVMEENYVVENFINKKSNDLKSVPYDDNLTNLNTNENNVYNNVKDEIEVSINKNTNKNIINLYENNFKSISQCPLEEKRINHVFKKFLNNEDLDIHINRNMDNEEESRRINEIKEIIMKYANNRGYGKDGDLTSEHNITPEERNKIDEFLKKHNYLYKIEIPTNLYRDEGKLKVNPTGDINVQKGGDSINSPGNNRNRNDTNNSGNNNNINDGSNNSNRNNSRGNNNNNNNDDDDDDDDNNNNNNRNNNNFSSSNNTNELVSKVKRRIIDCRNNRLNWGSTQVIIDIDDTIRSSGGYKFFNYNLGGVDAQYQRGETYPGSFQFIFELAMNKLAAEAKPLLLSVLTARIPQVPITEDSYLNKKFNEVAERRGIKHWGIDCENKILYSTLKEWVWNETRGEKKFFNFKQLHKYVIQQNSLVRYIWIGDTGDMDRQAGELMIKTFPQRIKAVFLHHVKGKDDNTLLPSDYFIKSVPIFFFRTYIGAATKAHAYNLIDKKGLTRVLVQAVLDLEKSKVPADSSKWEDLIKDIILSDALDELDKYNAETVNRTKRIIAQKMKEISERKLHFIS
ncbi:hypothetical protein PFNF135_01063 [Plasmodium falciparum NF135/5.C10]|uniref:Uncharacterized protein n=1 Tax=Plasmodium falciparum NF135/5.C10 TaxID=1036726 RepID=W4ILF9_PLAFA|nr:hypothetical protein PFNF135_01063 [Plasmodium falciparum NF135/5.C10]